MKYKLLVAIAGLTIGAIIFSTNHAAYGNDTGAPSGVTGSPGDLVTCGKAGCHTGTAVTSQPGWITSNIPAGGYTPGQSYTITATATFSGRNRFGFEISPQDSFGNVLGTLVNTSSQTQLISGRYVTHTQTGTSGTNGKTWTFTWTAPPSGTGRVTFYGAFNCANNNGFASGDIIYTSTTTVNEAATAGLDCGINSIQYPEGIACDSNITPVVKLWNYGTTSLDSVHINYFIDSNSPSTYTWTGSLGTFASATVTLPAIPVTAGSHTLTVTTTSPNGSTDVFNTNDTKTTTFNVTFAGLTLPFSEGFEAAAMPPSGWIRKNPDNSITWARTTSAHKTGVASAYMNNISYTSRGQVDELITPALDLTSDPAPTLTFELAYRLRTNPANSTNYSDTLAVLISTDCGMTWTEIYKKFGVALTTVSPTFSSATFTPTSSQWRQESVSLLPYASSAHAYLRFRHTTGYENRLYLDDIYINGPAGIAAHNAGEAITSLFPDPADNAVTMNYHLQQPENVTVQVFDMQGNLVLKKAEGQQNAGDYSETIETGSLNAGIYFVQLTIGSNVSTTKFMVTH